MDIGRRKFLKEMIIAGGVIGITGLKGLSALVSNRKSPSSSLAQAMQCWREYKGENFAGWTLDLGDALYACEGEQPVSIQDIRTIHNSGFSELQANVKRRCIMAHNITHKRIIDEEAFDFIHYARYEFRLPFLPIPDVNAEENAQTLEGGLFVWDGKETRFDYGLGFQIMLNPWSNFGELRTWSTAESEDGQWIPVGQLDPDMEWHSVEMMVDFQEEKASLRIDGQPYLAEYTKTKKPSDWATETAARLQAEIVSVWPDPAKIGALHRAEFRNWRWAWDYIPCTYLPVVIKRSTPTPSPTPTPTSTPLPTPTDCFSARIESPEPNDEIPNSTPFSVLWEPKACPMVLQFYQRGKLIAEHMNVPSGFSVQIETTGRTEVKIWSPGSSSPADSMWVTII